MKKLLAVWLSLALLLCCVPLALAAPAINPKIDAKYEKATGLLTLTWDPNETTGYGAESLFVDNKKIANVDSGTPGTVTATVTDLTSGEHSALIIFKQEGGGEAVSVNFSFQLTFTPEEELGFSFDERDRKYDAETGTLTFRWNSEKAPEGVTLQGIRIGNANYNVDPTSENGVAVITGLRNAVQVGDTDFVFVFQVPGDKTVSIKPESPLHLGGELKTELTLKVVNSYVQATLKDEHGRPVAGIDVYIKLDNTTYGPVKTDENGTVLFTMFQVPEDRKRVMCLTEKQINGDITYLSTAKGFGDIVIPPTTSPTAPTGTTSSGGGPTQTTKPPVTSSIYSTTTMEVLPNTTYSLLGGAGTTGIIGNLIAVNARYDAKVVNNFGLKNSDFESNARLLLNPDAYQIFVGDSTAALMLAVRTSPYSVNADLISSAILGVSKYSTYDAEHVGAVTVDLSVLLADSNTQTENFLNPSEGSYTIHLPIPATMRSIKLFAASPVDQEGLHELLDVTIENGYLSFTTTRLGSYAILGFAEAKASTKNDIPVPLLIIIIIGVLLLLAAGLLLFFFVIRRPRDPDDDLPPDDELLAGDWHSDDDLTILTDAPPASEEFLSEGHPGDIPGDTLPLVPLGGVPAEPAHPLKPTPPLDDGRDIYSSDSKRPSSTPDVSLGSFDETRRPQKKDPKDYDIDL